MRKSQTKSKKLAPTIRPSIRARQRRRAIDAASLFLRSQGVLHERGDSLVVAPRYKLMIAFDSLDLLEGIEKHAKVIDSEVVHIDAALFRKPAAFKHALLNAINKKPVYSGNGSKDRTNNFSQ